MERSSRESSLKQEEFIKVCCHPFDPLEPRRDAVLLGDEATEAHYLACRMLSAA